MSFSDSVANTMRRIFDDGLDEVLIFAIIFIFILLTGNPNDGPDRDPFGGSILPILLIGIFILLYAGFGRTETESK